MPFFESLSELIAGLSPHRRPDDRRQRQRSSANHRPQSSSPSHSPTRLSSQHRWLARNSKPAEHTPAAVRTNRGTSGRSELIPSDVDAFPSLAESSIARGRLRQPASLFTLEPSARPLNQPQMLGKDQQRNDAQARHDEARLLGGQKYGDDPNAVPIIPGATLQGRNRKTPGSSAAFKPADRISNHSRDSGPVRAQGKAKHTDSYLRRNPPRLDDGFEYEASSRPNKRPRHSASNQAIDLVNLDVTGPVSSVMDASPPANQLSPRRSPDSSQYSTAKTKSKAPTAPHAVEEFRDVEDSVKVERSPRNRRHRRLSSSVSQDEQFTKLARRQRHSLDSLPDVQPISVDSRSDISQRQKPLDSVGVQNSVNCPRDSGSGHIDGTRRASIYRESSDELQGEATTQPVPKYLHSKHQNPQPRSEAEVPSVSPARKRSPADIRPTNFTATGHQGFKKPRKINKNSNQTCLQVSSLRYGPIKESAPEGESLAIYLDLDTERIELGEEILGPHKEISISFAQIRTVISGNTPSRKVRLLLRKIANAPGDQVDLEFSHLKDKERLCQILRESQIKIQDKDQSFMDRAFVNLERDLALHGSHAKRPFLDRSTIGPDPTPAAPPTTRPKLSDSLQDATEASSVPPSKKHAKESPKSADGEGGSRRPADEETPQSTNKEDNDGVEIPVKKFRSPELPLGRATRSMARSTLRPSTGPQNGGSYNDKNRHSPDEADTSRQKWQKPLVYPRTGKKKAEVNAEDRDRLREGEFLNDNLIGFYIRFLQDHLERCNPAAAKRVYFFNSYFFDTLTNMPRGERAINYSGVEKWTRNVDLFSYDYIVVPINENAHWYVAIICNLPSLSLEAASGAVPETAPSASKESSNQPESEVQEILETPEPEASPATPQKDLEAPSQAQETSTEQETRQSLASMAIAEEGQPENGSERKEEPALTEEWPEREENPTSPPPKFAGVCDQAQRTETSEQSATASQPARKSKKKTRTGPKLDPFQTTIITFDSLDLGRSPTIRNLREYICKEAASKRGVEINHTNIKGMRARQIPLQPNYSDCGLYLLAYVEKFVQDPDQFIIKLLRRDMDAKTDWPPLGSGLLRHRLRTFLDDLYDEQARPSRDRAAQRIMADQQPVSYLLGPPLPSQNKDRGHQPQPRDSPNPEPTEKPVVEDTITSNGAEADAEDAASDPPVLVPTGRAGRSKATSTPSKADSAATAVDAAHTRSASAAKDADIIQVPDSQEAPKMPASSSRATTQLGRNDESSPETERGTATKRRKTERGTVDVIPLDPASRNTGDTVEVQIQGTPPPMESGHVRRSPRGPRRRD